MDYNNSGLEPQTNNNSSYEMNADTGAYSGKMTRRFISGILIGALCSALVLSGSGLLFLYQSRRAVSQAIPEVTENAESGLLTDKTLSKIKQLENVIDTYYYKTDVEDQVKIDGMYRGLMDSLGDPYSVYYNEEELLDLMDDTMGVYYGIGAYVSFDNDLNMARISGVMEGAPAEKAELSIDDVIVEVDGTSTLGLSLEEVVSLIKGEEGSFVHLTLLRGNASDYIEVDVQRAKIEVPTVSTKLLDDNIGYLKITEFDEVTSDQFIEGMAELRADNIKGLIIDLRSNPGGSLSAVCDVARQLLPEGVIVYTEDRDGTREDYTCDGKHEIDIPVVVLVNQYSASASEILSGALKDYGIAKLVGKTTYGKGIVQRIFDLRDGTAVKLTVSSYFTPNGVNIHGVGIEPDVDVDLDAEAYTKDKTDTQLDKAIEVMNELLDK